MPVEIKFCGLTRPDDAALGAALGASYLGVVFAPSPRQIDAAAAQTVFGSLPDARQKPRKVGVFGLDAPDKVARMAEFLALDVVQLHGDPSSADVGALRASFGGEIWATRRISQNDVPHDLAEIAAVADAILFDTRPVNGA
ncbi:MAG TPA: hypothetical protein VJ717_06520, partial [Gemmatimonadaceae bacterium]|nr:hypothetical protein [Gemmatimonadaceae bacterium]